MPRICQETGCESHLTPTQRKFCGDTHAAAFRQRRRRRTLLEERLLGPECEIDDAVLRVVDLESIEDVVDDVAVRIRAHDEETAYYRGVKTIRIVAECLLEDERRYKSHITRTALLA